VFGEDGSVIDVIVPDNERANSAAIGRAANCLEKPPECPKCQRLRRLRELVYRQDAWRKLPGVARGPGDLQVFEHAAFAVWVCDVQAGSIRDAPALALQSETDAVMPAEPFASADEKPVVVGHTSNPSRRRLRLPAVDERLPKDRSYE
jgi:hypothetical protein